MVCASFTPASSACACVVILPMPIPIHAPLCEMARLNNPLPSGDPTIADTSMAPADSPSIVTRVGSPPKLADVSLHPVQDRGHVHHGVVARRVMVRLFVQFGMREEAERAQPVVVSDDDRALARQCLAVIAGLGSGPARKSAAICPHDHGTPFAGGFRAGPDVYVKAVFAGCGCGTGAALLHADGSELVRFTDAIPVRGGLRSAPPQIANRRRGIGDSLEHADLVARCGGTRDQAGIDPDRFGDGCGNDRARLQESGVRVDS